MSGLHHKSTTSWSARSNFLPQQGGKVLGTEPGMSRSRAPSSTQKTCVAAPLSHSLRNGDAENSKYASPSQDKMAADARSVATIPGIQGAWPGGGIARRDIAAVEALFHCTSSRSLEPGLSRAIRERLRARFTNLALGVCPSPCGDVGIA
jgi:hypothetical protein